MDQNNKISNSFWHPQKLSWPSGHPSKKQEFSLPGPIIYCMAKNSEIHQKLVQTCKYFFECQPVVVVHRIYDGGKKICSNNVENCDSKNCCVDVDIKKFSVPIWLTGELDLFEDQVHPVSPNIVASICPKLFRCEKAELFLRLVEITWQDFKLLAAKFQKLYLDKVTFKDKITISFDSLIGAVPNIQKFSYFFDGNVPEGTYLSMMNLNNLKNLGNLKLFKLDNIPEDVDVGELVIFIKNHKDTKIWLHFNWNISEKYKYQLDALIDEIIKSEIPNRIIKYFGQDLGKYKILNSRYYPY